MNIIRFIVIGLTYIGLGLGYLPLLPTNRASIAIVCASLLMALRVLDLKEAWQAIDYKTLIFLFSMMVVSVNLAHFQDRYQSNLLNFQLSLFDEKVSHSGTLR
jgi:Na+/H+ antiporter NhaD/arsenite permease-like protein